MRLMEGESPKRTFWERLGRGVAQGIEKAKEATNRLGEYAGLKLDVKTARDHLEGRYRHLGRIAADRLLDRSEGAIDAKESAVAAALDEIRAARAALAELEKRLADSEEKPPPATG